MSQPDDQDGQNRDTEDDRTDGLTSSASMEDVVQDAHGNAGIDTLLIGGSGGTRDIDGSVPGGDLDPRTPTGGLDPRTPTGGLGGVSSQSDTNTESAPTQEAGQPIDYGTGTPEVGRAPDYGGTTPEMGDTLATGSTPSGNDVIAGQEHTQAL